MHLFFRGWKRLKKKKKGTGPAESAFLIGEKEGSSCMYSSDIFTVMANLAGIPAISIPVGLSQQRLSLGLQIMENFFQES